MGQLPSYEELNRPLPIWHPKHIYYGAMKILLNSIGTLSDGISLGLKYGFDSGVMLEYVYRNKPHGRGFIGRTIDKLYLDSQGWQGIRQRGEILKNILRSAIQENQERDITSVLLDVACGGGRYDLEVLADFPPHTYIATLRDYKLENVEKAQQLSYALGVKAKVERADAFNDRELDLVAPKPNIIIVSGLHEILPDNDLIAGHFHQLFRILEPGGKLIFTVQPYHPQLELIARVLPSHTGKPWIMRLRSLELSQSWAASAGFSNFQVTMDTFGIFGVVTCGKPS